jgi:hypothetical protein
MRQGVAVVSGAATGGRELADFADVVNTTLSSLRGWPLGEFATECREFRNFLHLLRRATFLHRRHEKMPVVQRA